MRYFGWLVFGQIFTDSMLNRSPKNLSLNLKNKVRERERERELSWVHGIGRVAESRLCVRFVLIRFVTWCCKIWYCLSTYSRNLPLALPCFSSYSCTRRGKHIHCSCSSSNLWNQQILPSIFFFFLFRVSTGVICFCNFYFL